MTVPVLPLLSNEVVPVPEDLLPAGIPLRVSRKYVVFRTCLGVFGHFWTKDEMPFVEAFAERVKKDLDPR